MKSTATTRRLLDRVAAPYWAIRVWWVRRRLYLLVGRGDQVRGERLVREAVRQSVVEEGK
ncbi:MAG TPA: hypothetical protein VIG24_04940 [Acidimicrobiia bacterium]